MKSMRLHIYIVLAIFVIGFIVGSFVDLSLSTAIFSRDNGFTYRRIRCKNVGAASQKKLFCRCQILQSLLVTIKSVSLDHLAGVE